MDSILLVGIVGFPLFVLLAVAGYAYVDAPKYGMNPKKWAAISFCIPAFGFFAYLFEREERKPDTGRDEMFTDGPFEIHKSRDDDAPFVSNRSDEDEDNDDRSRER